MKFTKIISLRFSIYFILYILVIIPVYSQHSKDIIISGKISSTEQSIIDYATVYLKGTSYGSSTNQNGKYEFTAPSGNYTLIVKAIGYQTKEQRIQIADDKDLKLDITMSPQIETLSEVTVESNGISRLQRSAYNAVAIDTKALQNSTQNLSDALERAPGLKVRESGGVGSDMQLMLDGFSGRHVKIFIDGVPQEGVGRSFGLNNIPVNYADRIEVYRGVVPVGFGSDAIGGVINIVTKKKPQHWFMDASYSYGSFNTHKSYVNFGQTLKNGFTYEVNAFQNYSDNSYYVDTPVKEFTDQGASIDNSKKFRVKRFHDNYHNEALVGKLGFTGKKWADRLMIGFTYSRMYNEVQNGVKQEIVYGDKHNRGYSFMPSLEYSKRNLITKGLDFVLTANYNKNIVHNVDTSSYEFNWFGEKRKMKSGVHGEQNYQNLRSENSNWNGTFTTNYRLGEKHLFTFNHVLSSFQRTSKSLLGAGSGANAIPSENRKNVGGLSYRLVPSESWNVSMFGKYYNQYIAGPIATSTNKDEYVKDTKSVTSFGYGIAGTYFFMKNLQAKLSYEKTYRLPTETELFGDNDLESGNISLKSENSNNLNFNLSYNKNLDKHSLYIEGGLIYRRTKDYIQRKIESLGSNKTGGAYENHGRVKTDGFNVSIRYGFSNWLSIGGNFTQMNVIDNVKTTGSTTNQGSTTYGGRIENTPYQFANSDITLYWNNLLEKNNTLTFTYDNLYMHGFPLRSENNGAYGKSRVPNQFSHNLTLSYAIQKGRYNLSLECHNFTNEKLYDNFSLQKAGRAFYGKVRVYFGK